MNLLVTGGAGYLGSIVGAQLVEAGHQVTVLDNLSRGTGGRCPTRPGSSRAPWRTGRCSTGCWPTPACPG